MSSPRFASMPSPRLGQSYLSPTQGQTGRTWGEGGGEGVGCATATDDACAALPPDVRQLDPQHRLDLELHSSMDPARAAINHTISPRAGYDCQWDESAAAEPVRATARLIHCLRSFCVQFGTPTTLVPPLHRTPIRVTTLLRRTHLLQRSSRHISHAAHRLRWLRCCPRARRLLSIRTSTPPPASAASPFTILELAPSTVRHPHCNSTHHSSSISIRNNRTDYRRSSPHSSRSSNSLSPFRIPAPPIASPSISWRCINSNCSSISNSSNSWLTNINSNSSKCTKR